MRAIVASQAARDFAYPELGATLAGPSHAPGGYPIHHHRLHLGTGREAYVRSVAAIRGWRMYDLAWTKLVPHDAPSTAGTTVAIVAHHAGLWSVNCCRVVYTIEDEVHRVHSDAITSEDVIVSGFAIGTLPVHVERGEERFTVEYHAADQSVWFELYSFARLHHPAAKLVAPLAGALPRRFAREAALRIRGVVT